MKIQPIKATDPVIYLKAKSSHRKYKQEQVPPQGQKLNFKKEGSPGL